MCLECVSASLLTMNYPGCMYEAFLPMKHFQIGMICRSDSFPPLEGKTRKATFMVQVFSACSLCACETRIYQVFFAEIFFCNFYLFLSAMQKKAWLDREDLGHSRVLQTARLVKRFATCRQNLNWAHVWSFLFMSAHCLVSVLRFVAWLWLPGLLLPCQGGLYLLCCEACSDNFLNNTVAYALWHTVRTT